MMCEEHRPEGRAKPMLREAVVTSNEAVSADVWLATFESPEVASAIAPGQFVHLKIATGRDFILRRPLSIYAANEERIEILYQLVGRGTRELALAKPGDRMDLIGPLGTGWEIPETPVRALLVAGGLGVAPLRMLAEALTRTGSTVALAYGAPTAERLTGVEIFHAAGCQVISCTDDGSAGTHGLVTLASGDVLGAGEVDIVYTCGPEVMQRAVAAQAREAGVRCQVSLERLMACGIGACLSCVVPTTTGQRRACVDGPVFNAEDVIWGES